MCKSCWKAASPEQHEEGKQAMNGWYCQEFGCWTPALRKHGFCKAHGGKNRSSSAADPTAGQHVSSSAADAAQAPLPEAIQQLIQFSAD